MVMVLPWGKTGKEKTILRPIGKILFLLIILTYLYSYLLGIYSIPGILFGIWKYNERKIYMDLSLVRPTIQR